MAERRHWGLKFIHACVVIGLFLAHEYEYFKRYGTEPLLWPSVFFISSFIISLFWFQWMFLGKMYSIADFDVPSDVTPTMAYSYRDDFIKKIVTCTASIVYPAGVYTGWKLGYLIGELIEWLDGYEQIATLLYDVGVF